MIQKTINLMAASSNALARLVDEKAGGRHVGFTIHSSYSEMTVMTNDRWRQEAGGIPMNSYLLATSLNTAELASADVIDKRVVLLRIVGRTEISTDRDSLRAIMEHFQDDPQTVDPAFRSMEPISFGMLQWSGIKCKVLGTFYVDDSTRLRFGADVEDFFAARQMKVLKPGPEALEEIVNFVDPIRRAKAVKDAADMGMGKAPESFKIGTVRFTSANHMNAASGTAEVPVKVFPGDFLARRTAVFGMTRTGKSNTTKTMVSAVALSAFETALPIGQIILDINGEYSNANNQDAGSSISEVFGDNTIRYRAAAAPGFRDVRINFYDSIDMGIQFIASNIRDESVSLSEDLQTFISLDLEAPEDPSDHKAMALWYRRRAIYQCILHTAGYPHTNGMMIRFSANKDSLSEIYNNISDIQSSIPNATNKDARAAAVAQYYSLRSDGQGYYLGTPDDAVTFWSDVRNLERSLPTGIKADKKRWLSNEDFGLLCVLVGRSSKTDTPIRSANAIKNAALQFHSKFGSANVADDIYTYLTQGRIVIVDLSVGPPKVREIMAERIARRIFERSAALFTASKTTPMIVVYVEEAHNLIGKNADLNTTWPRVAKEGAKYGVSLVYATQEPSSIHPNILSNTENFFVTHLNNDNEIRSLARYYDFDDFSESLKRCQDVGFARIKTLSANFTTPTQITLFEPAKVLVAYTAAKAKAPSWFKPIP
ncbi:DUF87 domain-containing protein [Methylobacterium sp. EM32]|uniref:ATP-binding protein n=1 Tax=Methylobacterium sp. EM32 TaxID=3163481 RepID=UPI0033AA2A52